MLRKANLEDYRVFRNRLESAIGRDGELNLDQVVTCIENSMNTIWNGDLVS